MEEIYSKKYWDENYSEPEMMDGIYNSDDHANYIKSIFKLEGVKIQSVVDFGCGYGDMLCSVVQKLKTKKSVGIEPSQFAFEKILTRNPNLKNKCTLYQKEMLDFLRTSEEKFDLGICSSVFQYVEEARLKKIVKLLSKNVKYLYLTVPTDKELARQVEEFQFCDRFALKRSRSFYLKLLKKHFTIVGNRLLESKYYFNSKNSPFSEFLFRLK